MRYVIISIEDWDKIDLTQCNESVNAIMKSVDMAKVVVSYEGDQPEFCYDISEDDVGLPEFDIDEIVQLIETSEWKLPS